MSGIEILLLVLGAVILVLGYLFPFHKEEEATAGTKVSEQKIEEMVGKAVDAARGKIEDIVDETVSYSVEKTERTMERISNEKIMAIHEYSDTVLAEINKNHEEEVFLYDMLNGKHDDLVATVSEAGKTVAEVKQTLQDAQITAKEAKEATEAAKEATEAARETAIATAREAAYPSKGAASSVTTKSTQAEGFVPIRPEVTEETDKVIPSYTGNAEVDPNAQLEEIIQKSVRAGKKKKAPTKKETANIVELEAPSEEELEALAQIAIEDEESEGWEDFGPGRTSPDIQLNKGLALGGNNNEHILEMHRAGKSNMAIAKELGLGIGEVKLVIDLYKGMGK